MRARAHYVTRRDGGTGAVREVCELILAAQDALAPQLAAFGGLTAPPMDRRARLIDRLVAWSPVLLLGGLAALTYWLDAQVQSASARRDGSARHDPDLYIENFRAVELRRRRPRARSRSPRSAPSTIRTTTASTSSRRRSR